ncbi:hypothetical protein HQ496_03440 [bacterium]|nr:hypothetical protein [bacterium]
MIVKKFISLASILAPTIFGKAWQSLAMVNPMCGAIYQRDHWLRIWSGGTSAINENLQISRILKDLNHTRRPFSFLAVAREKSIETTFSSSISWSLGTDVDWVSFNRAWSEEWLSGNLPSPQGVSDWDSNHLAEMLENRLGPQQAKSYKDWVIKFKALHSKN